MRHGLGAACPQRVRLKMGFRDTCDTAQHRRTNRSGSSSAGWWLQFYSTLVSIVRLAQRVPLSG